MDEWMDGWKIQDAINMHVHGWIDGWFLVHMDGHNKSAYTWIDDGGMYEYMQVQMNG